MRPVSQSVFVVAMTIAMLFASWCFIASDSTPAAPQTYYVRIQNDVPGAAVSYDVDWGNKDGKYFNGWESYSLRAGEAHTHWGEPALEVMDIKFWTGGANGQWIDMSVAGTPKAEQSRKALSFYRNNRGYLRIREIETPAGQTAPKLAAVPVKGPVKKNEAPFQLFESMEVELLARLNDAGVPVFLPEPKLNGATADYRTAMNLGIAVAGALSSAVNKNQTTFLKYAGLVHEYGGRLGMEEALLRKYTTIKTAASRNDWKTVQEAIYDLKDDITSALQKEDMRNEAVLAMVSGWLEGLYIVARSLNTDISSETAALLGNRDFVRYLREHLQSVDADVRKTKEVQAVQAALPEIDKVINKPRTYRYTREDVMRILQIVEPLRKVMIE